MKGSIKASLPPSKQSVAPRIFTSDPSISEVKQLRKQITLQQRKIFALEEEVYKRKREFQTVAENAPDVICRFNQNNSHLYVNPAIESAIGIPQHMFIGKTPHEAGLPKEFADYWVGNIQTVFTTTKPLTIEFSVPSPVGERHFQALLVPEFNDVGTVETVLSMTRDITVMKEQNKQKDEFLGIVSHELKTPITSLKVYAQSMHRQFVNSGDKTSADRLARMDMQLNKLTKLITELLDVTRIDGGKLRFNETAVDINELIAEVVAVMQYTTERHEIIIVGKAKRTVVCDRDRIEQVLINFISNAIKFAPEGSEIFVKVTSDAKMLQCCVQDFGVGISKEDQKKIFDRFFRVSGKKTELSSGMGLGLYISSEIIKRQRGKIWVESAEGKGATFCFTLPFEQKQ